MQEGVIYLHFKNNHFITGKMNVFRRVRNCKIRNIAITLLIILFLALIYLDNQHNILNQCLMNSYVTNLDCDCARAKRRFPFPQAQSSCDYYSTARGSHQKVVSYTFYGDTSSVYFQGVEQSVINVALFYPHWIMRLYHNINTSDLKQHLKLCNLWCKYDHLDLCDAKNLPYPLCDQSAVFGMIWRFFTLGDPLVDIFLVRDIDSPILTREINAVQDWISRNKTFHIMRDHPKHMYLMLGGMWGAMNRDKKLMEELRRQFISDGVKWEYEEDQNLLMKIVLPHAINDSVVHDSYTCQKLISPNNIPFPTRRENLTYVGMIYEWRDMINKDPLIFPCPEKCRPPQHPDWDYC